MRQSSALIFFLFWKASANGEDFRAASEFLRGRHFLVDMSDQPVKEEQGATVVTLSSMAPIPCEA